MVDKPAVLPEWATQDVKSDISGQYNVVEPPLEVKLEGWKFKKRPNRQWWNWFNRTVYDWIAYFNDNLDFDSDAFTPNWGSSLNGSFLQNIGYYNKQGDIVHFSIRVVWTGNTSEDPLIISNLPYLSKNDVDLIQTVTCNRYVAAGNPTLPNGQLLSGTILPNTTELRIGQTDLSTGVYEDVTIKGTIGRLLISGFYFTN